MSSRVGWRRSVALVGELLAFREERRLVLDTVILGIAGALCAQLFGWLLQTANALLLGGIAGVQLPGLPRESGAHELILGPHRLWLVPLVTTLGGLVSGALVYAIAPEAEGHGTDTAVDAFHRKAGRIRARVPLLKLVASAITIGSGGSAGREGPAALASAGLGSLYATAGKRTDRERRLLMLVGMAAGLSAIFRSPIGCGLFAIEVLYSEMEFEASGLVYTMLGSVVAYAVNGLFSGWEPLFAIPALTGAPSVAETLGHLALGSIAGLIGAVLPEVFYRARDLFHAIPIPKYLKPALGGLGVGLLALWLPQVLSGGYGWIQQAIDGRLAAGLLAALVLGKLLALSLTVSSGGSGGVFAPTLFIGAMLGGLIASLFGQPAAPYVVVGMASVFSGAARVPIATLLMVTEMTSGYTLLVPATLAVMVSYVVQVAVSRKLRYRSLYEAQVPGRAESAAHSSDYLDVVMRLIDERRLGVSEKQRHFDLRALLDSGVHIDLAEGKELQLSPAISPSASDGQLLQDCWHAIDSQELDVVAVFRDLHLLPPSPQLALLAGDRLLVIGTPSAHEHLATRLIDLVHA